MSETVDANFEFQKVIAIVGVTLLLIKYLAYFVTGSVAIFTDATESIVNVVAAFVGLYALYKSAQPADRDHPFGHGKVEVISATIEGALIIAAGAIIIFESVRSLLHPHEIGQLDFGIILVALAALVNFAVGRMAIRKGTKSRSPALVASGKHLCSDTYSSFGIIIGLIVVFVAQYMGYDARWLDSSIAILFGIIIVATGLGVLKHSVEDAMDKCDESLREGIIGCLNDHRHSHWIDVYNLRIIKYGPRIFVDMHVVFPGLMSVEDVNRENREIEEAVVEKYGADVDLSINPVPCRPCDCPFCSIEGCPNRTRDYIRDLEWNNDTLSCHSRHTIHRIITIEGCGDRP